MLCGLQRRRRQKPRAPGDLVVVMGPGPMGLLCAEMARMSGAGTLIVSGASPQDELRLAAAKNWARPRPSTLRRWI
ncbi:MAG: hypothetical protein WKF30_17240 [Pyrinomonadaceae bacterium]